jgi:putative ABC transport system permease protein
MMGGIENMIGEEETKVKIVGMLKEEQFSGPAMREEIILPITTAKKMPSLGFDRISDMISNKNKGNQYASIYVKTKSMDDLGKLKKFLDKQKINYFAVDDGLAEMKKAFLILDSVLGIIGLISLLVAGFGIINTMLMSILERKREIGIMKAVGGKNRDIRMIFFFEAGFIGLVGALGGISLGYGLTRIANLIVNNQYMKNADEFVDMFSFPWWLIGGSVLFSIIISLLAGLYPAIRASSIHPIDALRQTG